MTRMASDHYALDVSRAHTLLGWQPKHRLADELPAIVATLKEDPAAWYKANRIPAPMFVSEAEEAGHDPEKLRAQHAQWTRAAHTHTRRAHFINIPLVYWSLIQPVLLEVQVPTRAQT